MLTQLLHLSVIIILLKYLLIWKYIRAHDDDDEDKSQINLNFSAFCKKNYKSQDNDVEEPEVVTQMFLQMHEQIENTTIKLIQQVSNFKYNKKKQKNRLNGKITYVVFQNKKYPTYLIQSKFDIKDYFVSPVVKCCMKFEIDLHTVSYTAECKPHSLLVEMVATNKPAEYVDKFTFRGFGFLRQILPQKKKIAVNEEIE